MMQETNLYHCTDIKSLASILSSGTFWPSFCLERADYLETPEDFSFAMVCFADLLNSEVKPHLRKFNKDCFIRMSKTWARRNGLSNVIYYDRLSVLAITFRNVVKEVMKKSDRSDFKELNEQRFVSLMMAYFKQYEGSYWNDKLGAWSTERTNFFTEREWRYVPIPQNYEAFYLPPEDFLNKTLRQEKRQELIKNGYVLRFGWNDIEQIGVKGIRKKCSLALSLSKRFNVDILEAWKKVKRI